MLWAFCWNLGVSCCKAWFWLVIFIPHVFIYLFTESASRGLSILLDCWRGRAEGYRQSCCSLPFTLCPALGQEGKWDSDRSPPHVPYPCHTRTHICTFHFAIFLKNWSFAFSLKLNLFLLQLINIFLFFSCLLKWWAIVWVLTIVLSLVYDSC